MQRNKHSPSCFTRCWSRWRHCCCRYGPYPLIVAPLLTAGAILSLYSTAGCEFVDLTVGFVPSNKAWNQSNANFGLWYIQNDLIPESDNQFVEIFHGGCQWYASGFESSFIDQDRTWTVARVMSLIAATGTTLSAILAWLFCFTSLNANFFWPCVLLPLVMIGFIGEGSKFIIFDVAICSNAIWYPTGVNSLPQQAENCSLGSTAFVGIAAGAVQLIGLLLVIVTLPYKRVLDPIYGRYENGQYAGDAAGEANKSSAKSVVVVDQDGEYISDMRESVYDDVYTDEASEGLEVNATPSGSSSSGGGDDRDPSSTSKPTPAQDDLREDNVKLVVSNEGQEIVRISESRVSQMQKMKVNATQVAEEMIEKFVEDMNRTFSS